jgi:hypothetical protein
MGYDCVVEICEDAIGGMYPTAVGCEDPYVGMTMCLADLDATQWYCSDQDGGSTLWPAPVAGTACEAAICAWTCCEYQGNGFLYDINVFARCNCP